MFQGGKFKELPWTWNMLENSVENSEDPCDGLELCVARDVRLDQEFNHRTAREQEVRHQVKAVSLWLR